MLLWTGITWSVSATNWNIKWLWPVCLAMQQFFLEIYDKNRQFSTIQSNANITPCYLEFPTIGPTGRNSKAVSQPVANPNQIILRSVGQSRKGCENSTFSNFYGRMHRCPDTLALGHFGTKTLRHWWNRAEVSGHFGTGAEVSKGHFGIGAEMSRCRSVRKSLDQVYPHIYLSRPTLCLYA